MNLCIVCYATCCGFNRQIGSPTLATCPIGAAEAGCQLQLPEPLAQPAVPVRFCAASYESWSLALLLRDPWRERSRPDKANQPSEQIRWLQSQVVTHKVCRQLRNIDGPSPVPFFDVLSKIAEQSRQRVVELRAKRCQFRRDSCSKLLLCSHSVPLPGCWTVHDTLRKPGPVSEVPSPCVWW